MNAQTEAPAAPGLTATFDPPTTGSLTTEEFKRLVDLEKLAYNNFQAIGIALLEIRDSRLYRETHSTFESYCEDRWSLTCRRVNQLIVGQEVNRNLGTTVPERQARELSIIKDPEQQREAYQKAVDTAPDGKLTADHIKDTIQARVEARLEVIPPELSEQELAKVHSAVDASAVQILGHLPRKKHVPAIRVAMKKWQEILGRYKNQNDK
jgi:hypothetical protein